MLLLVQEVFNMQEKKVGELIAEAREEKGLSQRQLAKVANISNAQLSKI